MEEKTKSLISNGRESHSTESSQRAAGLSIRGVSEAMALMVKPREGKEAMKTKRIMNWKRRRRKTTALKLQLMKAKEAPLKTTMRATSSKMTEWSMRKREP